MNYYIFGGLFFAAYVLFVVYRIYRKIKNDFQKIYGLLHQIPGFRHTTYFVGNHSDKVIAFDEKAQLICLLSDIQTQGQQQVIAYSAVLSASVMEDGQTTMSVSRANDADIFEGENDKNDIGTEPSQQINQMVFQLVYQEGPSTNTFELALIDEKKVVNKKEGTYTVAQERAKDWQKLVTVIVAAK